MSAGHPVDEARLLKEAKNGSAEAFGQLYEIYAPQVFRFLYARLDDRFDAEDLTEETFIKVWEALPDYRQRGVPFGGFIFRVARNLLIDHYRSARHNGRHQRLDEEGASKPGDDPAHSVPAKMEHNEVRSLMARLSEDYRMVLSMRFLAGLSPDETAQAMGRSQGAIRVLQHRALLALRKLMNGRADKLETDLRRDRLDRLLAGSQGENLDDDHER
jgi:RNA polymerase sigma-70 factor (ECF subfamily)